MQYLDRFISIPIDILISSSTRAHQASSFTLTRFSKISFEYTPHLIDHLSFKTVVATITTPPLTKKSIPNQYSFTHRSTHRETHPASSPCTKIGQALVETRTPIGTGALPNSSRLTNSRRRRSRVYRGKIPVCIMHAGNSNTPCQVWRGRRRGRREGHRDYCCCCACNLI